MVNLSYHYMQIKWHKQKWLTVFFQGKNRPLLKTAFTWYRGTKDVVCLAWQIMSMSTEGQKTFTHGTSIQNQTQTSNITVQLTEETSSYLTRCNIQNSADRNVKYCEDGQTSPTRWCTPPVSHSAFLPTVLLMFQPLNKHWNRFQRVTSFLLQLWKLEIEPLDPTCCCFLKLVRRGWMLGCICWLPDRFPRGKELVTLLDQLLCLEETPQVKHLPCSQPNETAHGEYAEIQHACVGWL